MVLSSLLRSAIQTTDSTLIGCSANSAATMKLRPVFPVKNCRLTVRCNLHKTAHYILIVLYGYTYFLTNYKNCAPNREIIIRQPFTRT